ncbi:MAG: glycosyltransferase family 4 protein [Spirochaetia bacterium]|nr:glycosyltransferase family 4 protein [Spirochaetia bacterium]
MLSELIQIRTSDRWILFSNKPIHPYFSNLVENKNVSVSIYSGLLYRPGPLWVQLKLISELKNHKCDLLWATLAMLPAFYKRRTDIPAIVNFHDLNAFSAPRTMVFWNRLQHRLLDGQSIKNAHTVICLSRTTSEDIQKNFPEIKKNKLKVIYPGCELPVTKPKVPRQLQKIKNFILSVGTIEPRKNQRTMIEAYLSAREKTKLPHLILAGKKGWGEENLYQTLKSGSLETKGIIYLENPSMEELSYCYKQALFCMLPSIHEGFGLPVLEALGYGKQSIVSDIPIFREICKKCIFVEPLDIEAWSRKMIEISSKKIQRPFPFDHKLWSWERRAVFLSEVFNTVLS